MVWPIRPDATGLAGALLHPQHGLAYYLTVCAYLIIFTCISV